MGRMVMAAVQEMRSGVVRPACVSHRYRYLARGKVRGAPAVFSVSPAGRQQGSHNTSQHRGFYLSSAGKCVATLV